MLTLQFIPYQEIANLPSHLRIKKLLASVKDNKIVMLEGRLKKEEEAELIKRTMEEIDENFRGIELQVIDPDVNNEDFFKKIKVHLANILLGYRQGMTIIGPANIVKEIKKDPNKIELLTTEFNERKKRKGKRR